MKIARLAVLGSILLLAACSGGATGGSAGFLPTNGTQSVVVSRLKPMDTTGGGPMTATVLATATPTPTPTCLHCK
ncbi:MAG: hypothetical protein ABR584_07755 [Candidatus Baltobacteraceae bacterium]